MASSHELINRCLSNNASRPSSFLKYMYDPREGETLTPLELSFYRRNSRNVYFMDNNVGLVDGAYCALKSRVFLACILLKK